VSDITLEVISLVALVLTFVLSTSMLVVMAGASHRIPRFLLGFLQSTAAGALVRNRDWTALMTFAVLVAGVLFAQARSLELTFRRDGSLDGESVVEFLLDVGWLGYLLFWPHGDRDPA
jgi:hypothetical protein